MGSGLEISAFRCYIELMARPLRIEYPGATYHITSRGNARGRIYTDDADRAQFLSILGSVTRKYNWLCHAYCLMDNHYHLLIETPDANLSLGMRQLNGVYTQFFDRRHKRPGHVFQGRFKGILVDREQYLLELARYVVLNPVRARKVNRPAAWKWSSYLETAGIRRAIGFMATDWILGHFETKKGIAQARYRQFVAQGRNKPSPWMNLKGQMLLGEKAFVRQFKSLLGEKEKIREIPRQQRYAGRLSLEEIFEGEKVTTKSDRDRHMYRAHVQHGYTLKQIADHLRLHYTTVSKAIDAIEKTD